MKKKVLTICFANAHFFALLTGRQRGPEGAVKVAEALKVFTGSLSELNLEGHCPRTLDQFTCLTGIKRDDCFLNFVITDQYYKYIL